MGKNHLLETARKLEQVNQETAEEYRQKSDELIARINQRMLEKPEIKNLVGEDNLSQPCAFYGFHLKKFQR